jgi:hypothetical protein
MKTLRYNIDTKSYTVHNGQYKTYDGRNGRVDLPLVQLEVIEKPKPKINEATQRLTMNYFITVEKGKHDPFGLNGKAIETWQVFNKSDREIYLETWEHKEYSIRIIAPAELVLTDFGAKVKLWFDLKGLPIILKTENVHLYCNEILPQFKNEVEDLIHNGLITVEKMPTEE